MSSTFFRKLPTPLEIKTMYPVPEAVEKQKQLNDEEIRKIFTGESDKFAVIIGPCSADNQEAVEDYVGRLARVQEEVKDKLFIIPRVYTNKPRTTGKGYKGMLHQPDPEKKPDLLQGLITIRQMFLKIMEDTGFPLADEMLYPENARYFSDCLSYVAAQSSHSFLYRGWDVQTTGNDLAHAILRGAVNQYGQCIPNYHYEDMVNLYEMYKDKGFANPALVIDCNHSNSNKKYMEQIRIAKEIMHNRKHSNDLKGFVKGLMIESYIEGGNQKIDEHIYGKSITDPCLGWDDTEKLLHIIAEEA